jgi:transglutaminase-like putative cysteine protease
VKIEVGYEIIMNRPQDTPISLMLRVHPARADDLLTPDLIHVAPQTSIVQFIDGFGNICSRLIAPPGEITFRTDAVISDPGTYDRCVPDAMQHVVPELPDECLQFLIGSRYCETDKLMDIAWSNFNVAPLGWGRVQAICDFFYNHITFGYQFARTTGPLSRLIAKGSASAETLRIWRSLYAAA